MRFLLAWRQSVKKAGESAQNLVEFALVLPIFMVLLVGLVEVGDSLNSYLTVVDAGRDAARLGSKGLASDAEIRDLTGRDMERLRDPFDPAIDVTIDHDTMGEPSVKVSVCYDHALILPMFGLIPDPLHMCSSTTMRAITYD
jgi:hypothetical protein